MRFGCQVNHSIELPFNKKLQDKIGINNIAFYKFIIWFAFDIRQICQVSGVG